MAHSIYDNLLLRYSQFVIPEKIGISGKFQTDPSFCWDEGGHFYVQIKLDYRVLDRL